MRAEVGSIEPAWAVDADSHNVETQYRVDGNSIIQDVTVTEDTTFPVVADPKVTRTWWNTTVYFNRKETNTLGWGSGSVAAIFVPFPIPPSARSRRRRWPCHRLRGLDLQRRKVCQRVRTTATLSTSGSHTGTARPAATRKTQEAPGRFTVSTVIAALVCVAVGGLAAAGVAWSRRHRNWPTMAAGIAIYLAVLAAVTWQLGIGLVTSALVLSFVAVYVLFRRHDRRGGTYGRLIPPDAVADTHALLGLRNRPFDQRQSFGTLTRPG